MGEVYSCASGGVISAGRWLDSIIAELYASITIFALGPTSYTIGWPLTTGATEYTYSLDGGTTWASAGTAAYASASGRTPGATDQVRVRTRVGHVLHELSKAVVLPGSGAPTVVVKTIGTGGDYATMQAWNDAAPANLVAANQIWEGWLLNQVHTATYPANGVTLAGSTTDATRYKHLTVAPGCSFADHASRRSNPLRYNAAVGAAVSVGTQVGIEMDEGYCKVSRLQIQSLGNGTSGWGQYAVHSSSPTYPVFVDKCLLESGTPNFVLSQNYGLHVTSNCLVIATLSAANNAVTPAQVLAEMNNGSQVFNTLFVAVGQRYPKATVARTNNCLFRNCGFFGVDRVQDLTVGGSESPGPTYDHCYTDATLGTMPTGCTYMAFDTSSGSGFENTTLGSHDLRLKASSALIGAGVADTINAPVDIVGMPRPQGAAPDVGPWEYA